MRRVRAVPAPVAPPAAAAVAPRDRDRDRDRDGDLPSFFVTRFVTTMFGFLRFFLIFFVWVLFPAMGKFERAGLV
jgi:hypothetical protein